MAKRALPLLTGGLNELTRPDLIEDSQLQKCDNYEVTGDGVLRKRKSVKIFDNNLDNVIFGTGEQTPEIDSVTREVVGWTYDSGLFGDGELIKISEPYYSPTEVSLVNSPYSEIETDYILLAYGYTGEAYQLHILYKADTSWRNVAIWNSDDTTETLSDLLSSAKIIYTSNSDLQFVFAEDKVVITDGVNNAHFVAIDEDGIVRAGKMGLPAPKNRARIEPMTSVDKTLFETDTSQTYISTPGLVQVTYTAVTIYGDESNPAPVSQTFDMQYNKISSTDSSVEQYINKIKVNDLTVPDVSDNIMSTVKYFNFYIRVVPYKAGVEVGTLKYSEQQEITVKVKTGTETGNSYVLTLPSTGSTVSYENDVAPVANTASSLGGITMLGNLQNSINFPFSFKYFHPIKINNTDSASYVDANIMIRLYDKDSTHSDAIENLDLDDFINHLSSTDAGFLNTGYFRIYDEDLTTPLYCGFSVGDNGEGKPIAYKTYDDVYGEGSQNGVEYIDLIIQSPYLTANTSRTIYLCWTPESDRSQYTGVTSTYNDISSLDSTSLENLYNSNLGIHYGRVMNINSDSFSRQQFFKGSMLSNDQTYASYSMQLTYEGYRVNRADINYDLDPNNSFTRGLSYSTTSINHIKGFKTSDKWAGRIHTGTGAVGSTSMSLTTNQASAFFTAVQFINTSLTNKAGYVSFAFNAYLDDIGSSINTDDINNVYYICSIWGEAITSEIDGFSMASKRAITLFMKVIGSGDSTTYQLWVNDFRNPDSDDDRESLGENFILWEGTDALEAISKRHFAISWNSDCTKVSVWSYNNEGDIHYKEVDWDLKGFKKISDSDGVFYGVILGGYLGEDYSAIKDAKYDDLTVQIGTYIDPENEGHALFANIINQFPAYDNFIGYKHSNDFNNVSYNNNIKFSDTEEAIVKPRKNMVRWSDINKNAFPDLFFKSVREPVTKIVPAPSFLQYQYQNTFLIFTRNSISRFVLQGSASGWQGSASSLIEEKTQYGLYAPESLVRVGDALFWLSEVGVVMWDSDALRLISKNIIDIPLDKTYFAFENSIMNQYILSQKYPDTEQFVYHIDRNLWTKFNNIGNGVDNKGISLAVSLTGGSQTDNINLIYGHSSDKHIYAYPSTNYTNEDSSIKTKEMFFEKGILRRVKAGYTGNNISFKSLLIKDDNNFSEITKEHTVQIESNKWRGIPLGYNRGKSVSFEIENADTIESIMYELDIHDEVTV